MHKLIIEDDEGRTTVVPLVRDELTIGRKEGNTIRLTERNVSRRHARIFKRNGAICIEDFGSYTGVRVNGVRITDAKQVVDGDQVQIGDYKLSVRSEAVAESPLPAGASPGPAAPSATAPMVGAEPLAPDAAASPSSAGATGNPTQLDAAPTIPLRTLEEQGRVPKIASQVGRLVAVTTDLAGQEFPLGRPSLVIGRTEENDIILNHASISRHHAKVIRDGDRYTVVDLQSANGVRVAGESYERVDVQPGDVIELGQVKLRFVGPWEKWSFDPGEFAPKSRRKLKIGAGVGGVIMAIVLVSALQGKGKKAAPPPPPPAPVAVPVPAGPSPSTLLAEATKATDEQNWEKAVTTLDFILALPPGDPAAAAVKPRAAELKHLVDVERRNAETFAAFEQAVAAKEPDVALTRFEEIPADSLYKKRAEPALEDVKTLFLSAHLELADSARVQGRCDDARGEVEKIQQVNPENQKARDILKKCRPKPQVAVAAAAPAGPPAARPAAAAPTPRPAAPPAPRAAAPTAPRPAAPAAARPVAQRPATPHPARPPVAAPGRAAIATNTAAERAPVAAPAEEPAADAADLIRQAREAWMHQQCGTAIDLSRKALKAKPGSNDAHQIIAVCACSMKDRDGATKSYSKLDERSRAMVRTLCARNGVELTD